MIVNTETYSDRHKAEVAEFTDMADWKTAIKRGKCSYSPTTAWAGGTQDDFYNGCANGDPSYSKLAEPLIEEYSNVAIEDYVRTVEYNPVYGVLDYEAAMNGEVNCMYGVTIEERDVSPIVIAVDSWVSSTISPNYIKNRGIAVLALARALSVFRPVTVVSVSGARHSGAGVDTIQIIPIPSNPLDVNVAGFMLASPMFTRHGQIAMTHILAKENKLDHIPMLAAGKQWQETHMGTWLGNRMGVKDVVFLPMMYGNDTAWGSMEKVKSWVTKTMQQYMAVQPN